MEDDIVMCFDLGTPSKTRPTPIARHPTVDRALAYRASGPLRRSPTP